MYQIAEGKLRTMKSIIHLTTAIVLGSFAWSASLDTQIVFDDAKWLTHLDSQALKDAKGAVGFLAESFLPSTMLGLKQEG